MSGSYATDPNNRSSAEIEREVEATRAGLTETLDELRDRASPGQLFEQALDYARTSGGAEFARNLGQSVRDNPLPLLLIGAGIGWLMMSGGNRQASDARISGERLPGRPISSGSHYRVYGETESSTSPWPAMPPLLPGGSGKRLAASATVLRARPARLRTRPVPPTAARRTPPVQRQTVLAMQPPRQRSGLPMPDRMSGHRPHTSATAPGRALAGSCASSPWSWVRSAWRLGLRLARCFQGPRQRIA